MEIAVPVTTSRHAEADSVIAAGHDGNLASEIE